MARNRSSRRSARESDTFVVGNVLGQLPGGDFDSGADIVLSEEGNHRTTGVARAGIINDGLDAVADFDAIFAIVGSEEQENAGVLLFCADSEMFEEIDGVIFDGATIERANRNNGELSAGFLFKLGAERFEALAGGSRDDAGKVGDVAGRSDF